MTQYNQKEIAKVISSMKKKKGADKASSFKYPKTATNTLQTQLDNYKKRLGENVGGADSRNPLEKMLNLTPDQNFIFDIFEVLNRPQQALFGGLESLQQGENFLEGLGEGFTGNKKTSGGELLRNMGIGDDEGFGVDDVLGFGADVFLDPVNLITLGTSGAVSKIAGQSAKAVSKIDDLAKAGKILDSTGTALKTTDLASDLSKGLGFVKDASGKLQNFAPPEKVLNVLKTGKDKASLFDLAVKPAIYGGKKGLGLLDTKLNKFSPAYQAFSNTLKSSFNAGRKIAKDAISGIKHTQGTHDVIGFLNKGELANLDNAVKSSADNLVAKGIFKNSDDAIKQLDDLIYEAGQINAIKDITELPTKRVLNLFINESGAKHTLPNPSGVLDNFINELVDLKMIGEDSFKKVTTKSGEQAINFTKDGAKQLFNIFDNPSTKLRGYFNREQSNLLASFISGTDDVITDKKLISKIIKLTENGKLNPATVKMTKNGLKISNVGKDMLDSLTKYTATADSLVNATIPNVFAPDANDIDRTLGFLQREAPELLDYLDNNVFQKIKDNVRDVLGVGFEKDTYLARNVNPELKSFVDELRNKNPQAKNALADFTNINPSLSSSSILKRSSTDFMTSKTYNETVRDLKEISLLPFDFDYNSTDDVIEAIAENLGFKGTNKLDKVDKLLQLYDNGVLLTDNSLNALEFAKKYPKASADAKLMDLAFVSPFKNDIDSLKEASKTGIFDYKDKILIPDKFVPKEAKNSLIGYTELKGADISKLTNRVKQASMLNPETKGVFDEVIKTLDNKKIMGGKAYIDTHIAEMVNMLSNENNMNSYWKGITQLTDKINTVFKKGKLLSPTYNFRNVVGGATNLAMSGVPINDVVSLSIKNAEKLRKIDDAISFITQGGKYADMSTDLKKAWDLFNNFSSAGFTKDIGLQLNDLTGMMKSGKEVDPNILKRVINAVNDANMKANVYVDNLFRLTAIDYFKSNPDKVLELGFDNAGDVARWAMFDPSDMSKVEKDYIKKVVPFYTFTKKNLAYQFQNIQANPEKYYNLQKSIDSLWRASGVEDTTQLQDYQRTGGMIPIPFLSNKDNLNYLKTNLPTSDVYEWASGPISRIVNMTSPVIKAPFEMTTGINTFTGRPIEDYKGQMSDNIPFLPKTAEWGLGQFGLDVPLRTATNLLSLPFAGDDMQNKFNRATGLLGNTSIDKIQNSKRYQEIQNLSDYVQKLKDSGVEVPTLSELENKNEMLGAVNAQIAKLKGS